MYDNIVYILLTLPQEFAKIALENQPNAALTLNFVTPRPLYAEPLLMDSKKVKVLTTTAHDNILLNAGIGQIFNLLIKI